MCEYLLKKGCLNAIATYENYLKDNPNNKPIDLNLYLISAFYNRNNRFAFKKLSDKENEIYNIFAFCLTVFKDEVITLDNLHEYCNQDGFTNKFIDWLKSNNHSKYRSLLDAIIHNQLLPTIGISNTLYNLFIPYLNECLNIPLDKIDLIKEKIGTNFLLYVDNTNVIKFVNLDVSYIDKVLELYNCDKFSLKEFEDKIYDALKQEQFIHDYPMFKNIFNEFRDCIREDNTKELTRLKYLINTILTDVSYEEIDSIIDKAKK